MRTHRKLNISRRGPWTVALALLAALAALPAAAQRAVVPNFFDPQDRFEKRDVSALPRLRFLTVTDFPPFSYIDGDRQLVGYHVDLARALCERLDLENKCEIQALPFAELEKALANGEGEALMAGIAISAPSRERLAFTRPYFRLPAQFVAPASAASTLGDGTDWRGRRVAVRKGTAHSAFLQRFFPETIRIEVDSDAAALDAVRKGEAEAVFGDALRLARLVAGSGGREWRFAGGAYGDPAYFGRGLAIAVRPDDAELLGALNHALVDLNEKRVLEELYLRHFPIGLY